jgi:hypothetical protein
MEARTTAEVLHEDLRMLGRMEYITTHLRFPTYFCVKRSAHQNEADVSPSTKQLSRKYQQEIAAGLQGPHRTIRKAIALVDFVNDDVCYAG